MWSPAGAPPRPDEYLLRTHRGVSSRSVCEGQLLTGTSPKNFSDLDHFVLKFSKNIIITKKSSIEEGCILPVGRFVARVCSERGRNQISRWW